MELSPQSLPLPLIMPPIFLNPIQTVAAGVLAVPVLKQDCVRVDALTESAFDESNFPDDEEPFIKFVNQTLQHALEKSASDIHIESFENHCRIRYRQDGILYPIAEISTHFAARLITRLKIMARLNIAERRLPQDGRFQFDENKFHTADIRVSCCPTLFGEKIVLRITALKNFSLAINDLGLTKAQ